MTQIKINLYTTSHCHLCEQAAVLLQNLQDKAHYVEIEISENNQLMEAYGLRIPVLKRLDNNTELEWPFTQSDIENFILMLG